VVLEATIVTASAGQPGGRLGSIRCNLGELNERRAYGADHSLTGESRGVSQPRNAPALGGEFQWLQALVLAFSVLNDVGNLLSLNKLSSTSRRIRFWDSLCTANLCSFEEPAGRDVSQRINAVGVASASSTAERKYGRLNAEVCC
jgi:hypothetical protein